MTITRYRLGSLSVFQLSSQSPQSLLRLCSPLHRSVDIQYSRSQSFWFTIGHAMESTLLPLELVHEHRNYLPSVGLILGSVVGVLEFARVSRVNWLPLFAAIGIFFVFCSLTFLRASNWSDPVTLASTEATRNPQSYRAVYELGRVRYGSYLMNQNEEDYHASLAIIEQSASLDPAAKRPFVELIRIAYVHGDQPKSAWRDELIRRYRETLFHPTEWTDLNRLVGCHAAGECGFPVATLIDIFAAALSNSTVSQHVRAQLMVDLAILYTNELGYYGPATALLDDAVKIRPYEFLFNATRIEVMVLSGRFDEAETAIRNLDGINKWDDFIVTPVTRVADLMRLLSEARELSGN